MSDVMTCPYCNREMAITPDLYGRLVTCPHCQGQLSIPAKEAVIPPTAGQNPSGPPTSTYHRGAGPGANVGDVGSAELARLQYGMSDMERMMFISQYNSAKKDRTVALIISVLIGYMGVDRFYVGDIGVGVLKLITFGLCGIWWLIDLFLIMGRTDEYNRSKAHEIAMAMRASR